MHVLFLEPAFPQNQQEFVRALHKVGARVTALGEAPLHSLPGEIRACLYGYEQVPSVVNEPALFQAVRRVQEREWVDRLEATVEAHIMAAAHVREACSIPGTSTRTAFLCRDKPAMKEALREAGISCAQSTGANSEQDVWEFAENAGFPLILKPRDAAGAAGTYRADNPEELKQVIAETGVAQGMPTAVEEFIEGHEGFYDTLTIQGEVVHDFACHYFPGVLEAMRNRWISPQIICTNRLQEDSYQEVKEMGRKVIDILGIETSATHMEWFFGPKGLKFSEIGCRPPGVGAWDLYCAANEMDLYEEWAKAIVHGATEVRPSRKYSSGMIALRPDQDGRIMAYEGLEEIMSRYREEIIDYHFPPEGQGTQEVEGGYMANAWMRLRHPDYDRLREIMDQIGETVQVRAG
ncbi:MAG: ATP-grasp domain-containing protein [Planctomycetota bacterium]|nr:MAG: ATP-grasp domain-containing protein [Planctomycetota bacterium]